MLCSFIFPEGAYAFWKIVRPGEPVSFPIFTTFTYRKLLMPRDLDKKIQKATRAGAPIALG